MEVKSFSPKLMTQDEYVEYLKSEAKALEIDYLKMLERRAYLRYQAGMLRGCNLNNGLEE